MTFCECGTMSCKTILMVVPLILTVEIISLNAFEPVKSSEVPEIIRNLKTSSRYEIPASLTKKVASSAFDPLSFIFSLSLESSIIPRAFTLAEIIPLFKADDPCVFSNYHSIASRPCFCKVLETLVYSRILKHLDANNILFKHQCGFRKNYSTYMALLHLREKMTAALEKSEYT